MARLRIPSDLQPHTGDVAEIAISARSYRQLLAELCERYPSLSEELLAKYALAINGAIIPKPLLETFGDDAELVLFPWIQGG